MAFFRRLSLMNMKLHRNGPGLLVLLAALLAPPLHAAEEVPVSAAQMKSLGIETAPLPAQRAGELPGLPAQVVVPNNQLHVLSAPMPVLVERMLATAGEHVKKGQVLARLQGPAVVEMQRAYLQAATQLRLAKDNLVRDEKLFEEGIIAESRFRATRSQHAELAAAYTERRQVLRLAGMSEAAIVRLQSGSGLGSAVEIASPIDGVVLEQMASAGQRLEAASPIFKVAKLDPLWLDIQLPIARQGMVAEGDRVTLPAQQAEGRVLTVGHGVGGSQTVLVRAEITRGPERLHPGQYVEATVVGAAGNGSAAGQWSVPNAALARLQGRVLIFVQTAQGFRAVPVNVVVEGAQSSSVRGELKGDERIAVRGVSALKAALMGIGGE
jgi:RND family efflux transporter MFP subunit